MPSPAWQERLRLLDDATLLAVADRWGAERGSLVRVARSANVVARCRVAGTVVYLRVQHEKNRSAAELEAALAYHRHAWEHGAPVPAPLRSRSGAWVETVPPVTAGSGREVGGAGGRYAATALARADGVRLRMPIAGAGAVSGARGAAHGALAAWGDALARLHVAVREFRPAPGAGGASLEGQWRRGAEALRSRRGPVAEELRGVWGELEPAAAGAGLPAAEVGWCHGDARPANALLGTGGVTLIDFDEPARAPFAYDLARAVMALQGAGNPPREDLLAALLGGYAARAPLSGAARTALPGLVRLRAGLMLVRALEDGTCERPISQADRAWCAWLAHVALDARRFRA